MRRLQFGVFFGKTHILVVEEAEHDDRKADRHGEDPGLHGELIPYAGYGVPDLSTRLEPLAHLDPFAFFPGNAVRPPTAIPSRPLRPACFRTPLRRTRYLPCNRTESSVRACCRFTA